MEFKLPFKCDMEEMDEFGLDFGFLIPKQSSSFESPPSRKVTKKENFDLSQTI